MSEKVYITGASSGIGAALAIEYAKRGATLGISARRSEKLEVVAQQCKESGAANVFSYTLDVTNQDNSADTAKEFITTASGIDIVIANAGVAYSDKISSGEATRINKVFSTNVLGVTNSIIPFVPTMKENSSGKIVTSVPSLVSGPLLIMADTQPQNLLYAC